MVVSTAILPQRSVARKSRAPRPNLQNDDRHEIVFFGPPLRLSPHSVDHHSQTVVKKS
jgi:hypothetical protein